MAATSLNPVDPETLAKFRRAEEEQRFWDEQYCVLRERYPEQFVAVKDGAVVVFHGDLFRFRELLEARGLSAQDVYVEFLTTRPVRA